MKQNHYARKKRQFQRLSEQIDCLRQNGKWDCLDTLVRSHLTRKFKELYKAICGYFSRSEWKRAVATVGFILLGTVAVQAQNFLPPVQNPFGLTLGTNDELIVPTLIDLDQDGDLDVLGFGYEYGEPVFYENIGSASSPAFGPQQMNPFGLSGTYSVWRAVADLDNDGDLDLLTPVLDFLNYQTFFHYYENTGTANAPAYSAPAQVDPFGLSISGPGVMVGQLVDMDDDGDVDYLGVDHYDGAFYYYENTGTANSPMFSTPVTAPFGLPAVSLPGYYNNGSVVGDLDLDGDLDVITVYYGPASQFAYYENTGSPASPAFASPQINPFGLIPPGEAFPSMGDLDNDGDMDLLTVEYYNADSSASFYFYENTDSIIALEEQELSAKVYPMPFAQEVHVELGKVTSGHATVHDLTGRCVHTEPFGPADRISLNLAGLTAGSYLLELKTTSGSKTIRIMKAR